jgi:hypothetical protein
MGERRINGVMGKLERKIDHLEKPGVAERIIINWIFKEVR